MTEDEKRKRLKAGLEGHWEYICRVTSQDIPFPNGDLGRGGRMTISVSLDWTGVGAEINAERLWATRTSNDTETKTPMRDPIPWKAEGGVVIRDGRLSFEYFASDDGEVGITRDTYQIYDETGDLYLGLGEFTQNRKDGKRVSGIVKLRKMGDANDFQWAPPGIAPGGSSIRLKNGGKGKPKKRATKKPSRITVTVGSAGVFNMGDVGGDIVSEGMTQIIVKKGDIKTLLGALDQLGIGTSDRDEINSIVLQESPSNRSLGPKANSWLREMGKKATSGAWRLGKDVGVEILAEMLMRYYGVNQ